MDVVVEKNKTLFPCLDWGLIDYSVSNDEQQKLVKQVYEDQAPGHLIFCHHNPLVTTGRATKETDITSWQGQVLSTPRGGRATYHGPNQLVIYPVVNLNYSKFENFKKRDVTNYLRLLEKSVIDTLQMFDIDAYQRCEKVEVNGESLEATGVWVDNKKIASIGIAVRRWVTYHGIAINVDEDSQAFQGIKPCGFLASTMTSMEKELGKKVNLENLKENFKISFENYFQ